MKDVKQYINLFTEHCIKYNENYDENYNINTDCTFIGITGSRGKSSACYLLYQYLKAQGFKVCLWSSALIFNPNTYYWENDSVMWNTTKQEMSDFVAAAEQYMADYIIIECNSEAILKGVYDELEFDYKVLTLFEETDNEHMDSDKYLNTKLHFFRTNPCKSILNIDGDHVEDFLSTCTDKFTFSNEKNTANLYGTFILPYVDRTYLEYSINNNLDSLITTLPLKTGAKVTMVFLAILNGMNLYENNKIGIKEFLENQAHILGRIEDIQWNGRTIMIDGGNDLFIKNTIAELNSEEFKNARQQYIAKYGKDFIETEYNNVRALFSCIGGISEDTLYTLKADDSFVFKNTVSDTDAEVRKNFLIFGANLYLLIHGRKDLYIKAKDGSTSVAFYEIINELGEEYFLDFTTQTAFTTEYLSNLYAELCKKMQQIEPGYKSSFYKNFAWRSIVTLKDFFSSSVHAEDFNLLSNYFVSLGDEKLTAACEFVREKLGIVRNQFAEALSKINSINKTDIKKLYVTFNQYNATGTIAELEKTIQFINSDINFEAIVDRKETIKKMIEESEEGDLLLICGRGTRSDYLQEDGSMQFITDKEIINSIIK